MNAHTLAALYHAYERVLTLDYVRDMCAYRMKPVIDGDTAEAVRGAIANCSVEPLDTGLSAKTHYTRLPARTQHKILRVARRLLGDDAFTIYTYGATESNEFRVENRGVYDMFTFMLITQNELLACYLLTKDNERHFYDLQHTTANVLVHLIAHGTYAILFTFPYNLFCRSAYAPVLMAYARLYRRQDVADYIEAYGGSANDRRAQSDLESVLRHNAAIFQGRGGRGARRDDEAGSGRGGRGARRVQHGSARLPV